MRAFILVFSIVYILNLVPAFAPPTWMVFSFIGFWHPTGDLELLALAGALAATLGRVTLAKLSRLIIRQKFMSQRSRENIDAIREHLERRKKLTSGVFLFYAFSPLPSNYLFIAYGLTAMELTLVAIPFLIGRSVSYSFWMFSSSAISRRIAFDTTEALPYLSAYFIVSQILLLSLVYLFTRIDWRTLFSERKVKLLARGGRNSEERSSKTRL